MGAGVAENTEMESTENDIHKQTNTDKAEVAAKAEVSTKTKVKTRGQATDSAEAAIEAEAPTPPTIPLTISVHKRAYETFTTLFHTSDKDDLPGEISWSDILQAMSSASFAVEKLVLDGSLGCSNRRTTALSSMNRTRIVS
ncbi:MAG: hypothetical protein FRX48_07989 [Lasallia pustulata]|uniref:Uncharacterized protein n=1 Tax=Lasallia pustulata TaxID=136370 RepID=A0A5M8PFX9_9LECA|nr:MAG: hypothetical protein FRX48_07989 [Lasallia pustulata]